MREARLRGYGPDGSSLLLPFGSVSGWLSALRRVPIALLLVIAMGLGGCATAPSPSVTPAQYEDPLEDANRAIFAFNEALDAILWEPLARLYRFIFPEPVRQGIRNVLRNLGAPIDFANQVLQADAEGAVTTLGRFIANTTAGVGGIFDVGSRLGWAYEREDFGQTLAVWGVEPGPYIVLPLFGPSNLRDTVGLGVDRFADPVPVILDQIDEEDVIVILGLTAFTAAREELLDSVDELRRTSVDYYATVRSINAQQRATAITDGALNRESPEMEEFPEFDDLPGRERIP